MTTPIKLSELEAIIKEYKDDTNSRGTVRTISRLCEALILAHGALNTIDNEGHPECGCGYYSYNALTKIKELVDLS